MTGGRVFDTVLEAKAPQTALDQESGLALYPFGFTPLQAAAGDDGLAVPASDIFAPTTGDDPIGSMLVPPAMGRFEFSSQADVQSRIAATHVAGSSQPADAAGGGDPSGQLWYGAQGSDGGTSSGSSDNQVGHIDSDAGGRAVSDVDKQDSDAGFQAIGLDTSAGIYFALDGAGLLRSGHITNDTETNEASQFGTSPSSQSGTEIQLTDAANEDEDNAIAVDPVHHIVYTEIFGADDNRTAIIAISYNPTTGVMSSPYNSSTGALSAGSTVISNTSTGGKLVDVTAMSYDIASGKLYYIDDDLGYSFNGGAGTSWGQTKNIYVVDTTSGNPSSTLTQLTSGMNAADTNTYIAAFAVDEAKGLIYYAIDTVNTHSTQLYWIPITGGAGTAMSMPSGVSLTFTGYFGNGSNAMAIDQNAQQLYVADSSNGHIVQLTLSADGHSFTSGNSNFEVLDGNPNNAYTGALLFDDLPVLTNIAGTSTEAVQGSGAVALLTATPGISDKDNVYLGYAKVVVTNAQSGDVLSAATGGTAITASYSTATHTLTLTGDDTFAHYQSVLDSVQFQDTGTDNSTGSHPTRSLSWTISDGTTIANPTASDPNVGATTLTIDRAPTVVADGYAAVEGSSASGTSGTGGTGVLGNDSDKDGDTITVSALNGSAGDVGASTAGTYGQLTLNANGSLSYQANNTSAIDAAATGSHPVDTFSYTVSDGINGTTTSTVSFTINRAPTVAADAGAAVESASGSGNVLTNDSDRDGDTLTVAAVAGSAGNVGNSVAGTYGHITIGSNGGYTYTADKTAAIDGAATGSHLTDTFSYTASDGHGGTTTTNLVVTPDRAPTAVADTANVAESANATATAAAGVLSNDGDRDGDSLSVSAVAGSAGNVGASIAGTYGHLTLNANGSYSYLADNISAIAAAAEGAHPIDSFAYTVSDGHGGTTSSTVSFAVDRPAIAANDAFTTDQATAIGSGHNLFNNNGSGTDHDPDGSGAFSVTGVTGGTVGTQFMLPSGALLTVNADGTFSYNPNHAFDSLHLAAPGSGASDTSTTDTFSYTITGGATATATVTVDGTDTANTIYDGSSGNDTVTGDATQADLFHLEQGGNDHAIGGSADDGFYFGGAFTAADTVDGGGGTNNQIGLEGDYSGGLTLGASTLANIQVIACLPGFSYNLTTVDANVAAGQSLTIWAAHLGANNTLTFDGSAESNGTFTVFGGAGDDTITGGAGADTLWGLGGADRLTGNGGADTFVYTAVSDSTGNASGTAYDTIVGFDATADRFHLPVAVNGIDPTIASGALSAASFDTDLAAAVGASQLTAGHAVLFDPDSGTLGGHTFLIVDANGVAGYQSGADFVFDITGASHLGGLATGDFIG